MPAPPSSAQKAANAKSIAASKAKSESFGGISTSTVKTQDRGSTNKFGPNAAQQRQEQQSQYRSPPSQPTKAPVSQAAVVRQQTMGKPILQSNRVFAKEPATIAPGSPDAQYLANQYRAYKNPSIFTDAPEASVATPPAGHVQQIADNEPVAQGGLVDDPPRSPLGQTFASLFKARPDFISPNIPVDVPRRGNTIFKDPAPVAKMQDRLPQDQGGLYTAGTADAPPIPRQNPLSDTDKFTYGKGRNRDYVFGGDSSLDGVGEMDQTAVSRLVSMQEDYGEPFRLTSGFRGPFLNKKVDGAEHSQHLSGNAFDVHTDDPSRANYDRLAQAARDSGFTGYGAYRPGSLHVDTGPNRVWGPSTPAVKTALRDTAVRPAAGDPSPRNTVVNAIRPFATEAMGAVKAVPRQIARGFNGIFNPNGNVPIPQQKPRVPSIVAPSRGVPIPRQKPARAPMAGDERSHDAWELWRRLYEQVAA